METLSEPRFDEPARVGRACSRGTAWEGAATRRVRSGVCCGVRSSSGRLRDSQPSCLCTLTRSSVESKDILSTLVFSFPFSGQHSCSAMHPPIKFFSMGFFDVCSSRGYSGSYYPQCLKFV